MELLSEILDPHQDIVIEIVQKAQKELQRTSDSVRGAFLCGQIRAAQIYTDFLNVLFDDYGFISRAYLEEKSGVKLSEEEFESWIGEQQAWLAENNHIPDRAQDYPLFLKHCADTIQTLLADPAFLQECFEAVAREIPVPSPQAIIEGMNAFITEINERGMALLPGLDIEKPETPNFFQALKFH